MTKTPLKGQQRRLQNLGSVWFCLQAQRARAAPLPLFALAHDWGFWPVKDKHRFFPTRGWVFSWHVKSRPFPGLHCSFHSPGFVTMTQGQERRQQVLPQGCQARGWSSCVIPQECGGTAPQSRSTSTAVKNGFVKNSQNLESSHSLVYLHANTEVRCADLGRPWNRDDTAERERERLN